MARTIILFGRCERVCPERGATHRVLWTSAYNFATHAGDMIHGEFENATVIAINTTPASVESAAVHISVDRSSLNFRGFDVRFWLGDKPYPQDEERPVSPLDFDWAAFIPCTRTLV
ncbi:MAG: hypothetical protein K6T17_06540 [Fimbriimonadales bacterium]|nr:hypothetical protein [Fimbriimonadales bacterium]